MCKEIILGTRGSELALAQSRMVIEQLKMRSRGVEVETKIIKTSGDDRAAADVDARAGRKGLFTGELERALIAGDIDIAVHSAKDLPSILSPGTTIGAVLPRGCVDDVLISFGGFRKLDRPDRSSSDVLVNLPKGAVVATGSVRRQHQLRWKRPDLEIVELRGNVPTRLRKLYQNNWDGIVLARAGLERLSLNLTGNAFVFEAQQFSALVLPQEIFLPAGGQGTIAIQSRADDVDLTQLLHDLDDRKTHDCVRAEREFLRLLNADCNQPVGVLATMSGSTMNVRAQIFDEAAAEPRTAKVEGDSKGAEELAAELFAKINRG